MQSPQQTHHHGLTAPPGAPGPRLLLDPAQPPSRARALLLARPAVLSADPAQGTATLPAYLASFLPEALTDSPEAGRRPPFLGTGPTRWEGT